MPLSRVLAGARSLTRCSSSEVAESVTSSSEEDSLEDEVEPNGDRFSGLLIAFYVMEERRIGRVLLGKVKRVSWMKTVMRFLELSIMFAVVSHLLLVDARVVSDFVWIPWLLTAVMILFTLWYVVKVPENQFFVVFQAEIAIFFLWVIWSYRYDQGFLLQHLQNTTVTASAVASTHSETVTDSDHDRGWYDRVWRKCYWRGLNICFLKWHVAVAACVFLTTFCAFIMFRCIVPALLYRACRREEGARCWWGVRGRREARWGPERHVDVCFSYRPHGLFAPARAIFGFVGFVDAAGRPHGQGRWYDNSYQGECLIGVWVHGRPFGAFSSRAYGSSAQFCQRPVGYASARDDCPPGRLNSASLFPKIARQLRHGVALVEVSYAGVFFSFLPRVNEETALNSIDEVIEELKELCPPDIQYDVGSKPGMPSLSLKVVSEAELAHEQEVAGCDGGFHYASVGVYFHEDDAAGLVTPGLLGDARHLVQHRREAFVFVHGWNCTVDVALGRVAQIFALGHMAPHVVPFVFAWSAGCALCWTNKAIPDHGGEFARFVGDLGRHFRDIHIVCHSMGAYFFLANWDAAQGCFAPSHRRGEGGALRARTHDDCRPHLVTLTLVNQDVRVEVAARMLPRVMDFAERLTTYNDRKDVALATIRAIDWLLPARIFGREGPAGAKTVEFGQVISPLRVVVTPHGPVLSGPDIDSLMPALTDESPGPVCHGLCSNEPDSRQLDDECCEYIDVVDCSEIEHNVAFARHNYYALNSMVALDICDLVGTHTPARQRNRLVQKAANSNVFSFLSPPSYVVS